MAYISIQSSLEAGKNAVQATLHVSKHQDCWQKSKHKRLSWQPKEKYIFSKWLGWIQACSKLTYYVNTTLRARTGI